MWLQLMSLKNIARSIADSPTTSLLTRIDSWVAVADLGRPKINTYQKCSR